MSFFHGKTYWKHVADYNDIIGWAESAYPSDMYDKFSDWLKDVINDFGKSGHTFQDGMVELLQEHWLEAYGSLDLSPDADELTDDEIVESEQEAISEALPPPPKKSKTARRKEKKQYKKTRVSRKRRK